MMPEDPTAPRRRAFISYRHESEEHRRAVLSFCQRLTAMLGDDSVEIVNDQTLLETRPAGPDEGWNRWSMNMAAHAERVIGIVSPGWFAAMDQKDLKPPPGGKGSAVEATVIFNRHTDGRTVSPWLRLVRLPTFPETETNWLMRDIPVFLGESEADIQALARWIKSTDAQGAAPPPSAATPPSRPKPAAAPAKRNGPAIAIAAGAVGLLAAGAFFLKPLLGGSNKNQGAESGPARPPASPAATAATPVASPEAPKPALNLPENPAAGALGEVRLDAATTLRLRWCPPGSFLMGRSTAEFEHLQSWELNDRPEERQQETITLAHGFWMAETELTRRQAAALRGLSTATANEGDDLPLAGIPHAEAVKLGTTLSDKLGTSGWIARLPTEPEWEYACRAGTTGMFAFGDQIDATLANYNSTIRIDRSPGEKAKGAAAKVASYRENPWHLFDMHGNVAEWCLWQDPSHPAAKDGRFPARGGSYKTYWIVCTSGARNFDNGSPGQPTIGLRLLLAKPTAP